MGKVSHIYVLVVALLGFAQTAQGSELPFGADTLGYLSRKAETVVRSREPAALKLQIEDPREIQLSLYSVRVEEVLKGALERGRIIRIALLKGIDVRELDQFKDALLFLRRLKPAEIDLHKIGAGDPAYLVLSGQYGVLAAKDAKVPNLKAIVQSYINTVPVAGNRTEQVLGWTNQFIQSPDPFLQRSAMYDLYFERSNPRAIQQLGFALKSDSVSALSKRSAIQALEASASPMAVPFLKSFAEDERMQPILREDAVRAFKSLPDGDLQLQQWRSGGDRTLSITADKIITERQ